MANKIKPMPKEKIGYMTGTETRKVVEARTRADVRWPASTADQNSPFKKPDTSSGPNTIRKYGLEKLQSPSTMGSDDARFRKRVTQAMGRDVKLARAASVASKAATVGKTILGSSVGIAAQVGFSIGEAAHKAYNAYDAGARMDKFQGMAPALKSTSVAYGSSTTAKDLLVNTPQKKKK